MTFIITLVSNQKNLSSGHLVQAQNFMEKQGIKPTKPAYWLSKHIAADISVPFKPNFDQIIQLRALFNDQKIDVFVSEEKKPDIKLLLADMDSTIVSSETLDDIAEYSNLYDKIAPITEKAMRGELKFEEALKARVSLLKGLDSKILDDVLDNIVINEGVLNLITTLKNSGTICVLVSGGFTFFTKAIAQQVGFDHHHGNTLEILDNLLTGEVIDPILGKEAKLEYLEKYKRELSLEYSQIMSIGDGANDLPMLLKAGKGFGFHPKPLVKESLENCIIHGNIDSALYALGFGISST